MPCFPIYMLYQYSRFIAGALNGNVGVMKSVIGDITDHTNLAQAFVLMSPVFSVGASVAYVNRHMSHVNAQTIAFRSLYGGALTKPHEQWPALFSGIFWQTYPYFLPCLISALFTTIALLIAAAFLKEVSMSVFHFCTGADPFTTLVITAQTEQETL